MIIFLNGASSVGKSSIARQIMRLSNRPFIYFSIDHLVNFWMDEKFVAFEGDNRDWFYHERANDDEGNPITKIADGPNAIQLHWDMIESLGVLIRKGYDIVIDEVIWQKEIFVRYAPWLAHSNAVFLVKITCDLIECEKRESQRQDRFKGLARSLIHDVMSISLYYDLEIDTTYTTAEESAKQIITAIEQQHLRPTGFAKCLCEMISFRPLENKDFSLLFEWLNTPHVKLWWVEEAFETLAQIEKKYQSYVHGYKTIDNQKKPLNAFIIYCGSEPIGYIQYYNAYDFPRTGYFLQNESPSLAAMDLYIGSPHYLKKGIGASLIDQFLNAIVWKKFTACMVDPDLSNDYAIKLYEKVGFQTIQRLEKPRVQLMIKRKT